jgi:hypothetical protein
MIKIVKSKSAQKHMLWNQVIHAIQSLEINWMLGW